MNKNDFIAKYALKTEQTKKASAEQVDMFLETLRESLIEDNKVAFMGDWSLEIKEKAARVGRNPGTGEEIQIPAKNVVKFKCGKVLTDLVNR